MIRHRISLVAACAAAVVLAACGAENASITAPPDASYDSGFTFGGGNRSDTTTTTTAAKPSVEGLAAGSGGSTFGGGN